MRRTYLGCTRNVHQVGSTGWGLFLLICVLALSACGERDSSGASSTPGTPADTTRPARGDSSRVPGAEGDSLAAGRGHASGRGGAIPADSTQPDRARADSTLTDSTAGDSTREGRPVPVETVPASVGSISSYLLFNSTVETEAAVEIYPQTTGLVREVRVEEGDCVKAGDVLVEIDADELRLKAEEARIDLQHLEKSFKRTQEMFRRQLISHQEFENKQYELEQARLRAKQAQLNLEHATIRAPFSGVITERLVQVGARVSNGTKLMSMIKLEDMIARVYVPGQYLNVVRQGQPAQITTDFLPGLTFDGWVKRISPVVDPHSGTFKVTVGLKDRWEHLRPGIFVKVRIVTDTHPHAVLIPKQAVVYDGGERFVFVVRDGRAVRLPLEAGYETDTHIEVLHGLKAGEQVIVVGQNGLKDQARVKRVERSAAADTVRTRG